jgi:NADPH:quinone reductase-like Zn-dependent oxidoreductase
MKAIVQDRYGSADVLELKDIDNPMVGDDEALVRVRAASINVLDWRFMRGRPVIARIAFGLRRPRPVVRGRDVAGQVEAVGKGVEQFKPGDEVFGCCDGAFAEYVCASADSFVPKPANTTFEDAAATGVAALTALQGLRDIGGIESGQKVMIIGASGGVGTFALQIAKSFGAEVTGVCSTRNVDLVRTIGADHVIDYTQENCARVEQQYDLIFQLAGTHSPLELRRVLAPKGTLVMSSGMGRMSGLDRILKALASAPFVSQKMRTWVADENQEDLAALKDLVESGSVIPVIDRRYSLREAPEAIRYVEDGHTQGKVVITV